MILYICDYCAEANEGMGYPDADHLRIYKGEWMCQSCYEDTAPQSAPQWRALPKITKAEAVADIHLPEAS